MLETLLHLPVEEKKWNEVNEGDVKKPGFLFLIIDIPSCCINYK